MYILEIWFELSDWDSRWSRWNTYGSLAEAQKEAKKFNAEWRILQIIEVGS